MVEKRSTTSGEQTWESCLTLGFSASLLAPPLNPHLHQSQCPCDAEKFQGSPSKLHVTGNLKHCAPGEQETATTLCSQTWPGSSRGLPTQERSKRISNISRADILAFRTVFLRHI